MIRSFHKSLAGRVRATAARTAGLCALALAATAGVSHAQAIPNAVEKPFAIKLGGYVPSGPDARRASSDVLFSVEADYTLQTQFSGNRTSYTVLSVGYIGQDDLRIIPITLGQIYRGPENIYGLGYYLGGGIGLYSVDLDLPDTTGQTKTLFGLHAVAGLDVTRNFLVELKYHYPFDYDKKFVGGLQFMAGMRF